MKQKAAGTSSSRSSTRPSAVAQTVADILRLNLRRLCKRSGMPMPSLTIRQKAMLQELFVTAYSEAIAQDERRRLLEGIDSP